MSEELEQSTDHIRKDIEEDDDRKPTSSLIQLYEMPWRDYLKRKNYDTDINNMCRNCQREQIGKYGEITIKCSGPKDISVLDQNVVADMNKEELDEIKQAMSPVYWAEKNIDVNQPDPTKRLYVNRWYQSMQITCLHGDSEILMSDGSKKKIKDVNIGDMVVSYNETRRSTPTNKVLNKWNNGKKEVFRITLENGDYIDATADHKILGWIRTGRENQMLKCPSFRTDYGSIASGDIKVGTDIYVLNKYKIFGKEENTRIVMRNISNISKDRRNGRLKRGAFNTSTRVKIVSIESIGVHDVYDIEVDKRHNFIANNVIVHNCSASKKAIRCGRRSGKSYGLGIDIANRLVQNSNYQILVVTPFLSQAKELTSIVKKILRSLGDTIGTWAELVERSVTSPYQEIQMKNGSTFKAFTAGNDNANSVRGQGAHLIIIDEADFLTQEAFDSITAILMDKPNTEIVCTSTPMGEGLLCKFANSKDYKEFHFPSFCIPHYNDDMDREFRNSLSMMAYIQEIMAEFGLSDNSVFDTDLVNRSTTIGTSESLHDVIVNRDRYIVSLGCDWNADKVGTRICVIAYSKVEHKVIIANLSNVRREGWTQVAAVEKIVELNRLYLPDYIYVDEGFGEANVQQLKLIAVNLFGKVPTNHPDLRLRNVTPVNFASTLELRDVMTGEIRKKYFKNFIVETTKRALETGLLAFKDPISAPIVEQMKNYVIKSRAANGREVYEAKNNEIGDHDLDAFMIALAGLQLNEDSILDTRRYSNVTILPLEKRGSEAYNNSNKIEKRSYSNEEKYHRTVRVAPGINRRSSITGGPMGSRGSFSRETASTFMNRYKTAMRSKPR